MSPSIVSLAKKLWDYHKLNHELWRSDCILVLGSNDLRVPEYAARLFLDGWAPLLIFSGGLGNFTKGIWDEPEAIKFAKIALEMGVPENRVIIESESTNTGENLLFTQQLLQEKEIDLASVILVQKPFMERRAYASIKKKWPEKEVVVTSPPIPFNEYPSPQFPMSDLINAMVGDFQRILIYPKLGYQIPQEIPQEILDVYHALLELNFNKHLVECNQP